MGNRVDRSLPGSVDQPRVSRAPKPAKLATNLVLRAKVEQDLKKKFSPEQITGRLLVEFPNDPEMRVSPERIYQSLCKCHGTE